MSVPTFTIEPYCDDLGPEKVVHVYEPQSGLRAIVVVDNTACGPAIGGVRLAADVSMDEVYRLARAMTLKNAAAGLPHGGGKAGIVADPHTTDKLRLVRAFARAIREIADYIPGPDMGTDEACMAWLFDEIGRRDTSSTDRSEARRTPPMAGPHAVLSTTTIARNPL